MSELTEWIINELCQQNAVMAQSSVLIGSSYSIQYSDLYDELTSEESEKLDEIDGLICSLVADNNAGFAEKMKIAEAAVDAGLIRNSALQRLALKHEVGVIKYRRRMAEESMADQEVGK